MAGTLVISTLSDGTNSTSSTNCIQGSAKAWATVNTSGGASASIIKAYNVSSVTFIDGSNFAINFTNTLADANYAVATVSNFSGSSTVQRCPNVYSTSTNTTSSCRIRLYAITAGNNYCEYTSVIVFD